MKSIEKLREWSRRVTESDPDENIVSPEYVAQECGRAALRFADEIEREIAERYQLLPVDADGVPIRVGDVMEFVYDPPQDQPKFGVEEDIEEVAE